MSTPLPSQAEHPQPWHRQAITYCDRHWQAHGSYLPLILVSGILLIGPFFYVSDLEHLFIFCGGWANFVAFSAIAHTLHEAPRVRSSFILLFQAIIIAVLLGLDLDLFLGPAKLQIASVLLAVYIFGRMLRHLVMHRPGNLDTRFVPFWSLLLLAILITPYMESLTSTVGGTITHNLASRIGISGEFLEARYYAYLHLLFIPALYLVCDVLNRRDFDVSNQAIPLDIVTLFVGITCTSCGALWNQHASTVFGGSLASEAIFESGAVAAVLLLTNWIFVLYVHKPSPQLQVTAHGTTT